MLLVSEHHPVDRESPLAVNNRGLSLIAQDLIPICGGRPLVGLQQSSP